MSGSRSKILQRKADAAVEAAHPEWTVAKKGFAAHQLKNRLKKAYMGGAR